MRRFLALSALALALPAACRSAHAPAAPTPWSVRVVVDGSAAGASQRTHDVRVAPGSTALEATRAAALVEQAWVCCSDDDVWSIDGLESDAARDGYWSWWLDGALGPGFAHQVPVHDGATIEWRYALADPQGLGAEPVARLAVASASACRALERFGGGRNLVAHGVQCRLEAHSALPRLSPTALPESWSALEPQVVVDGPPLTGVRALRFDPGLERADWEALGEACGRLGAARVAWTSERRSHAPSAAGCRGGESNPYSLAGNGF
jgi:hypothetical protein